MRFLVRTSVTAVALTTVAGCSVVGPTRLGEFAACERATPVRHDLLVLFTDKAVGRRGMEFLKSRSQSSIEWSNQAYLNSCVNLQVRIVDILRSPMQESGKGIIDTQLALRTNSEVAALRDRYYADLVLLISEDSGDGWTGVGSFFYTYRRGSLTAVDSFAVVKASALDGATVAHELGHMQGLDHDREHATDPVPGKYHYGYQVCAKDGFRDIMSAGCRKGVNPPVIQLYSNPRISYNGYAAGVDPATDPMTAADAARGLNDMAVFIATFRER
jgi:hypothetical protein